MRRPPDERHKRIALWIATGGTMAVIVALWLLTLPMQLERNRLAADTAPRWGVAAAETPTEPQTLQEIIEEQRMLLQRVEQDASSGAESGDLSRRIEQATVAKSVTRTNP